MKFYDCFGMSSVYDHKSMNAAYKEYICLCVDFNMLNNDF